MANAGGGELKKAIARSQFADAQSVIRNEADIERVNAAERARSETLFNLGNPGTFEKSFEDIFGNKASVPGGSGAFSSEGIFSRKETDLIKLRQMLPQKLKTLPTNQAELDSLLKSFGAGGISSFDPAAVDEFLKNPTRGLTDSATKGIQVGGFGQIATATLPNVLDPQAFSESVLQTRQGRQVSFMTAQADQLVRKEGPLYESLANSVLGPIYQGAATAQREAADIIAKGIARGGSARRQAELDVQKIQNVERINAERTSQLWQANLELEQFTIANSRQQLAFNQAWVSELPGIRDGVNNSLTQLTQFFTTTTLPSIQDNAFRNFEALAASEKDYTGLIIGGSLLALGLLAGGIGGLGAAGFLGSASSSLAQGAAFVGELAPSLLGAGASAATGGGGGGLSLFGGGTTSSKRN